MRPVAALLLTVVLVATGDPRALAQELEVSGRVRVLESEHAQAHAHGENVVVWLLPLDFAEPARPLPRAHWRLAQHNKTFEPHLLVVPVGAVVEFPNRDPFFHNVFSLFNGKRFDLGLYEAGTTRNVSFDRPGISYIFCNIHAEMSAVVIALETPYFGISNRRGEIDIAHVPAGRYTMRLWYETALPSTLDAMTREIRVGSDQASLGLLEIPAGETAHAHKNKYGMDYEPPPADAPGYSTPE